MNLNGKVSNPGELRVPVTLQSRTISSQTGGFQKPVYSTIATVWARWVNVHGNEAWAASAVMANQPATVLIRYRTGIDTTCAVLKGTDLYEIKSIDDIQEMHEYLELKVQRMVSG